MSTVIHSHVDLARRGELARVITRLRSGWAVLGESQLLEGYCLLLPDPVVGSLNDIDPRSRAAFLLDMTLLGDAVARVTSPRRLNYEILGNLEPALHAHVIPRFEREPADLRTKAVWLYPPATWNAPEHRFDAARHAGLIDRLRSALRDLGASGSDYSTDWMI
jgi:diadenosine tetraphosphate (Ap4A) HIT family hydrolase